MSLEGAKNVCTSLEGNWTVTYGGKYSGAIVCSTVDWSKNCNDCDTWRLYVWQDGACLSPSKCEYDSRTIAGHYYCGNKPCKNGNFVEGGPWPSS